MMSRSLFVLSAALLLLVPVLGAQPLYVQIDLTQGPNPARDGDDDVGEEDETRGGPAGSCSILQIDADGTLTELVSNADILAVTGETSADCDNTGLAVAPDGTIYFGEDESDDILRRSATGALSVFVESDDLDALVGTSNDSDNGMDVGPDGTLFVADEDCNCIFTVSPDGNTLEVIVTENDVGLVTGNLSGGIEPRGPQEECTGEPAADLEGGLVVAGDGTVYFADDGSGCNPDRPQEIGFIRGGPDGFDSLDSILRAVPDGSGGYTVSIVADEDDIFAGASEAYPAGFGECAVNFADLDIDIDLGSDGFLYVLEDGQLQPAPQNCPRGEGSLQSDDKVLRIDPDSGAVSLVAGAPAFGALSGTPDPNDQADFEGGIAYTSNGLFVGDNSDPQQIDRGQGSLNTIFQVSTGGSVSVFVSNEDLQAFYGPMYGGATARLLGGLDAAGENNILEIPVAGSGGLATLMALLAALGLWTVRRRM